MRLRLDLQPGVVSGGAPSSGIGRFTKSNLVRWVGNSILPIGGWAKACATQVDGKARAAIAWRQNDYTLRTAIGTHKKLYILYGGSLFDVTPAGFVTGRPDSVAGFGYSYAAYGRSAFGGSGVPGEVVDASVWSLDTWGEQLVGCSAADGRLWAWKNDLTQPAVQIPNSPTGCAGLMVTPERHLIAIGPGGDKYAIQWCNSEDYTTWVAADTNSAGGLRLNSHTPIVNLIRTRGETLLFTGDEVFTLDYKGYPYIYGTTRIAGGCGIAGPNAATALEIGVPWMARSGFFIYDGSTQAIKCDIADDIVAAVNWTQRQKIVAAPMSRFGEVWWLYPSTNSTEIDSYAAWNTRTGIWSVGKLTRTAWSDAGILRRAMGVDADGTVYDHEQGWTADGASIGRTRMVRTGPVCVNNGSTVMAVRRLESDATTPIEATFYARDKLADAPTVYGPYTGAGRLDVRFTARFVDVEIRFLEDADWRAGVFELDVVAGGGR
jgi:hypothetical protein